MRRLPEILLLAAALTTASAAAQDVAGTWNITSSTLLGGEEVDCVYSGTGVISQEGAAVSGPVELDLQSGPAACPSTLEGMLSGEVGDGLVAGTITDDELGVVDFSGTLAMMAAAGVAYAADTEMIEGDQVIVEGPFEGSGTWSAILAAPAPTLPSTVLVVLALLLAAAGALVLRRRRA